MREIKDFKNKSRKNDRCPYSLFYRKKKLNYFHTRVYDLPKILSSRHLRMSSKLAQADRDKVTIPGFHETESYSNIIRHRQI